MRETGSGEVCPHAGCVQYGGRQEYCGELDQTEVATAIEQLDALLGGVEDVQESEYFRCHTTKEGCTIERELWWVGDDSGEARSPVQLSMDIAYKKSRQNRTESYEVRVEREFYRNLKRSRIATEYVLGAYAGGTTYASVLDHDVVDTPHASDKERAMTAYDLKQLIGELGCARALTEASVLEQKALDRLEQ